MQKKTPHAFWPPLYAGIGLGLTLLAMFLVSAHGLGAYGFFRRVDAQLVAWIAPEWGQAHKFFHPLLQSQPLDSWITWQIIGLILGALVASLIAKRWHWRIERGHKITNKQRIGFAFVGGILSGLGAALADGCTSGLGLSGASTLAVASFVFLAAFFVSGILVARLTRGLW